MNTRAITEGGLMCGVAVIMALLCYYMPFFLVFYIFIPLPMVVLSKRQGFITALVASIAASIILFFFIDWMSGVVYAMYLILVGCSLGYTYYKDNNGLVRMLVTYGALLITLMASLYMVQVISGVPFISQLTAEMESAMGQVLNFYENSGLLNAEQFAQITVMSKSLLSTMKMVLPSAFLMTPALVAWLNVLLCDRVLKRLKADFTPLKPLTGWRLPRSLKLFMLLLLILTSVLDIVEQDVVPQIYLFTITQLVDYVFILMGLSFFFWLFNRKREKESTGIKIIIVLVCVIFSPLSYVLSLVGVADSFLHLREIISMKDAYKGGGR